MTSVLLLLAALAAPPAVAQDSFSEVCANELRLLCPDMRGRAARRCLLEDVDSITVACRNALSAAAEAAAASPEEGPRREARLIGLKGPVYIHPAGRPEGEYVEATADTPLAEGDWLRVGAGADARIAIDGDTYVSLSSGTDLGVTSLASAGLELRLALGSLAAKVRKLAEGQAFRVRTPTVVAAVRGTELVVEEDGEGEAGRVAVVDEGRVEVTSEEGGEPVLLGRRQETVVRAGRPPEPPRALEVFRHHIRSFGDVRRDAAQTAKAWRPLPPEARAQARANLAARTALGPGNMPGLNRNQQNRPSPGQNFRGGPGNGPGRGPGMPGMGPGGQDRRQGGNQPGPGQQRDQRQGGNNQQGPGRQDQQGPRGGGGPGGPGQGPNGPGGPPPGGGGPPRR